MTRSASAASAIVLASVLAPASALSEAWQRPAGGVYLRQSGVFWRTSERFANSQQEGIGLTECGGPGSVRPGDPIRFGGDCASDQTLTALGAFTDLYVGITDWIEVYGQLPVQSVRVQEKASGFGEANQPVPSNGLGDIRVGLQLTAPGGWWPAAIRYRVKLPTADPPRVGSLVVPISEGQTDHELDVFSGLSLGERGWLQGRVTYRVRDDNPDFDRFFADEVEAWGQVGIRPAPQSVRWLHLKVEADHLRGLDPIEDGFGFPVGKRRLTTATVGVLAALPGGLSADAGVRWLLAGEDFPTGVQITAGLAWSGQLIGPAEPGR